MQTDSGSVRGHGFGTAPVFLAAISTILGAILFLRFGYAVGHVGILGAFLIVLIGHAITIPTGLAVAEIATNLKVEGGGEYYIISRSFGLKIGAAIGISLYLSQAVSVAFYMIAFSEAFRPLFPAIQQIIGFTPDPRMIGIPATLILILVILYKGANLGVSMLWIVSGILAVSLGMFFMGDPVTAQPDMNIMAKIADHEDFFTVFAIVFPAFTGMTAGVGLSGDLKNPRRSIPLGTMAGTLVGMVVYLLVVVKLGRCATPEQLAENQFIMSDIALWGPIIYIGLGAATLSSAIGSILVAPRTLQALAMDRAFGNERVNTYISKSKGEANEPVNATLFTSALALLFVSLGNVDFVAQIISMFFMVTYGSLCAISFFQHFAGNPSYRPTFRTKWYLSGIGALSCLVMMYLMQPMYSVLALIVMTLIYLWMKKNLTDERDLSSLFAGVLSQIVRNLQLVLQKRQSGLDAANWRPSMIAISAQSFKRLGVFDLLRWISQYYGFGSYIHYIEGPLTRDNNENAKKQLQRLIGLSQASRAGIYVDTIISPSFKTAVAQIVQIPGISGMDNNTILFDYSEGDDDKIIRDIVDGTMFASVAGFNVCVLRSSKRHFGYKRTIHIWFTPGDYRNANLMILLAYIISGHHEWDEAEIKIFAAFEEERMELGVQHLNDLIAKGRLPISPNNIERIPMKSDEDFEGLVNTHSEMADLVITGLSLHKLENDSGEHLRRFENVNDILFVWVGQRILITED